MDVIFSGLEAGMTASHIHCCVSPNGNAGVATVPTFAGLPLGVTSGFYISTLDPTSALSFNPAFITANGGIVAGAEAALATGLEDGMAYLNIHTTASPAGEMRAFLVPVPESASAMLAITALAGFCCLQHRRAGRER